MWKFRLLAVALLLNACSMVSNLQGAKTSRLILIPQYVAGQFQTKTVVNANTQPSISHLLLELKYSPSLTLAATRDIPQVDLTKPIQFGGLRANTSYRVIAKAYKTADTSQLISTDDADSYVDFTTTSDDRPAIATLKVRLQDVAFNGQGSSSITVTPGGYSVGNTSLRFVGQVETFAGAAPNRDGIGTNASFVWLGGLTVDNGFLYVSDYNNHRIRKVDLATNAVTTLAGTSLGYLDGPGASAQFNSPRGAVVAGGYLYVADSNNHRIRKVNLATNAVSTVAGSSAGYADGTGTNAQFYTPSGVAVVNSFLYVADGSNNRIRKIDLATNAVTTIAGSSDGTADGTGTSAQFSFPFGIAADNGFLYVSDYNSHHIRKLDLATNAVTTVAGSTAGNADGIGTSAQFNKPRGLNVANGFLYVADSGAHCIRRIELSNSTVTTIAGGTQGYLDNTGTSAQFNCPSGVAISNGSIYITDGSNRRVRKLDLASSAVTTVAGCSAGYADGIGTSAQFSNPRGMAVADGFLYVADPQNNAIRKVSLSTHEVTTFVGGTQGSNDGTGTSAQFNKPRCVAVANGFLYVADSINHRIRKVDLATREVTTIAGSTVGTNDGIGSNAQFSTPSALTVANGFIYVSDVTSHRIRMVDLATNEVTTLAGSTQGSSEGTGTNAQFYAPWGLAVVNNYLYVADNGNNRIRKIHLGTLEVTTLAGSTQGTNDGPGTNAQFYSPVMLAPANGFIYVADSGNERIRKVDLTTNAVTTVAGSTAGTNDGIGTDAHFSFPAGLALDVDGVLYVADTSNGLIRAIY